MRTIVFFGGQNLYHLARSAWSPGPQVPGSPYGYPRYDVEKLAASLVARHPRRVLKQIRFLLFAASVRPEGLPSAPPPPAAAENALYVAF